MNSEKPRKTPIQDEMARLAAEGAFERKQRHEPKPVPPVIRDMMRELAEAKESLEPASAIEEKEDNNQFFPEQGRTAEMNDEGNIVVPESAVDTTYYPNRQTKKLSQRKKAA
jgi:hypothetical protein